jgi:Flp pilus assembly protein TadG
MTHRIKYQANRDGVASVEFALVAPVFLTLVLGVAETSKLFDVKMQLAYASREGARMASMERDGSAHGGQATNAKVISDVRHFLGANGLSGNAADVEIVDPDDHTTPLDLDDPLNDWALFELKVTVPYAPATSWYVAIGGPSHLTSSVVFRNGRSTTSS